MSLIATGSNEGQKDFELTPQGNHRAVCYMVADLGMQKSEYKGVEKNLHKIKIGWELVDEQMKDGRPFGITKNYTLTLLSMGNLRKDLESWRGRAFSEQELSGFDVFAVLGHGCLLNVVHSASGDRTYANVASIAKLPKGMTTDLPTNPIIKFSLSGGNNLTPWESLPKWLQEKINREGVIAQSDPSGLPTGNADADPDFDDEIEF